MHDKSSREAPAGPEIPLENSKLALRLAISQKTGQTFGYRQISRGVFLKQVMFTHYPRLETSGSMVRQGRYKENQGESNKEGITPAAAE